MNVLKKCFLAVSGIIILLGIIIGIDIYTYPREPIREKNDAAIVLGAAIWDEEPSPVFKERLNHAGDLYRSEKIRKIILTGGYGENERFSESETGEKYLIQNGIPPENILKETTSKTTYQNLENTIPILEKNNISKVSIVSDPLHLRRAVLMAKNLGLDASPSPTPTTRYQSFYSKTKFLLREIYFYVIYLVFGQ